MYTQMSMLLALDLFLFIAGVALLGAITSYNMALGREPELHLFNCGIAASFFPHDVFAFVNGGTGARSVTFLSRFAGVSGGTCSWKRTRENTI